MSVVNRMLQDIDLRRAAAETESAGANKDIRSIPPSKASSPRRRRAFWTVALIICTLSLTAILWQQWPPQRLIVEPTSRMATAPTPPIVPVQSPAIKEQVIPASESSLAPLPVPQVVAPVAVTAVPVLNLAPPTSAAPQPQPRAPMEKLKLSMQLSALVAEAVAPRAGIDVPPQKPPTTPGRTTITTVPARQIAADETVSAARGLWNDGSRIAAVATIREALAVAEAGGNSRATATLARELARLHVADNSAQAALDLLNRFDSLFAQDADALALRGNAEQRLSRHAEAAATYQAALRMRPTEGKWMLGAAISLAAIGKIEEAEVWVEKARERQAVTPTIAAYLQQLGIAGRSK